MQAAKVWLPPAIDLLQQLADVSGMAVKASLIARLTLISTGEVEESSPLETNCNEPEQLFNMASST